MRFMRIRFLLLGMAACLLVEPPAFAVEWAKKDFQLFGYHTQQHLWASAAATFTFAQVYQYYGMEHTPALAVSAIQVMTIGIGKEFIADQHPGENDLIADSIGILIGSLANVTIRFDFSRKKTPKTDSHVLAPEPVDFEK
jgi:hypothetical protein